MSNRTLEILGVVMVAASVVFPCSYAAANPAPEDETEQREGTWVGAHIDDVTAKWGDPSEKRRDGRGGWTLVYLDTQAGVVTPEIGVGLSGRTPPDPPPQNLPEFTEAAFWIGENNLVYDYWFAPSAYQRLARKGLTTPPAGTGRAKEGFARKEATAAEPPKQEWRLRGKSGTTMFVYISPTGLGDEQFVARVLGRVIRDSGETGPITVMIFDDWRLTPTDFPLTSGQRFRQKAEYSFDPAAKTERFVWLSIKNPLSSPVELEEEEAEIRADLDG